MREEKEAQLVHELIEATRNGRISWEATASIDEFTTSFKGKYSATVSRTASGHYILRIVDEADRELLNLEHGSDQVLTYFGDFPEHIAALGVSSSIRELFDLARGVALHVDAAIDDILAALKD